MTRLDFTYQSLERDEALTLPCKLLAIGNFSGYARDIEGALQAQRINKNNFATVMRSFNIELFIESVYMNAEAFSANALVVQLNSMADFQPQVLLQNVPYLAMVQQLIQRLEVHQSSEFDCAALSVAQQQVLASVGVTQSRLSNSELLFLIGDLHTHLSEMLDTVLHDEQFRELESLWRSTYDLVMQAEQVENAIIELVNLDKEVLFDDFEANINLTESALFDLVYAREFAQYGGQPYCALIANYRFNAGAQDLRLLSRIAEVSAAAHAPFIAAVDEAMMQVQDFAQLPQGYELEELFLGPKYIKWRKFTEQPEANFVALTLPSTALRARYAFNAGDLMSMAYVEGMTQDNEQQTGLLLGNASFAFAKCLLQSYQQFGVCSQVAGAQGGQVPTLLTPSQFGLPDIGLDVLFSEQQVSLLAKLGFMPLANNVADNHLNFATANSVRWAAYSAQLRRPDASYLNAQAQSQLPYVFITSKIAHYLKMVQRELLGGMQSASEIEQTLLRWIKQYVSEVENPSASIKARKPLKSAELTVTQNDDQELVDIRLAITPHMKFMGQDFVLGIQVGI